MTQTSSLTCRRISRLAVLVTALFAFLIPVRSAGAEAATVQDLLGLIMQWGSTGTNEQDRNADGMVNVSDLLDLLANWNDLDASGTVGAGPRPYAGPYVDPANRPRRYVSTAAQLDTLRDTPNIHIIVTQPINGSFSFSQGNPGTILELQGAGRLSDKLWIEPLARDCTFYANPHLAVNVKAIDFVMGESWERSRNITIIGANIDSSFMALEDLNGLDITIQDCFLKARIYPLWAAQPGTDGLRVEYCRLWGSEPESTCRFYFVDNAYFYQTEFEIDYRPEGTIKPNFRAYLSDNITVDSCRFIRGRLLAGMHDTATGPPLPCVNFTVRDCEFLHESTGSPLELENNVNLTLENNDINSLNAPRPWFQLANIGVTRVNDNTFNGSVYTDW